VGAPPLYTREDMMGSNVRITFEVDAETHKKLCRIPHGMRKNAYRVVIQSVAEWIDRRPSEAMQAIFETHFDPRALIKGELRDGSPEE